MTKPTTRQELIEHRFAVRMGLFPELSSLAKLAGELRDAGASWSVIANLVDRLASVRVTGQTLRTWLEAEDVTPGR